MVKRLTVADIRAAKGKHQFTMVRTEDWESLEAAERAGVEMVSVPPEMMVEPRFREVAPTVFAVPGGVFYNVGTADDHTRWAFRMLKAAEGDVVSETVNGSRWNSALNGSYSVIILVLTVTWGHSVDGSV